jgi:hypothetical protein
MTYTFTSNLNLEVYQTETIYEVSLDVVWKSIRNLFSKGTLVTIVDENGNSKRFQK